MQKSNKMNFKRLILLILFMFGIPFLGFVGGYVIKNHDDRSFREEFTKYLEQNNIEIQHQEYLTLSTFCSHPEERKNLSASCDEFDKINLLIDVSMWTGIAGFLMLLTIMFFAKISTRSRNILARTFSPCVRLVLLFLVPFVIIQAVIFIYVVYLLEAVFVHKVHIGVVPPFSQAAFKRVLLAN